VFGIARLRAAVAAGGEDGRRQPGGPCSDDQNVDDRGWARGRVGHFGEAGAAGGVGWAGALLIEIEPERPPSSVGPLVGVGGWVASTSFTPGGV
jgi:hypothetical protein